MGVKRTLYEEIRRRKAMDRYEAMMNMKTKAITVIPHELEKPRNENWIIDIIKEHEGTNHIVITKVKGKWSLLFTGQRQDVEIYAFSELRDYDMPLFLNALDYCVSNEIEVWLSGGANEVV